MDASVEFRYFSLRKVMLVKYSCAYIVMPRVRALPPAVRERLDAGR